MPDSADIRLLAAIEQTLASPRLWGCLPAELAPAYGAALDTMYRQPNRIALAIFTVMFDLFLVSQTVSAPELVPLSAALRLAVFTPAVLMFLLLDCASVPLPRPRYDIWLFVIAILPGIISAVICVHTVSTHSLSDVHATTLILLTVGLIIRMRPAAVYATAAISCAAFLASLLLTPAIPQSELPALMLTDLAIAASVTVFSTLLNRRDRIVFLLNLREQIRARALDAQNRGLRRQVDIDGLTGLANRRCFDTTLADAWRKAQDDQAPISLIMIDVDHFKLFNDHYGHLGGDDCLRRIARQTQPELRGADLMARYGGEEFAVILPGAPLTAARNVADRLRATIEDLAMPHEGAGPGRKVSISLGVASVTPSAASQAASLVEVADRCLYAAKHAGRNCVSSDSTDAGLIQTARP